MPRTNTTSSRTNTTSSRPTVYKSNTFTQYPKTPSTAPISSPMPVYTPSNTPSIWDSAKQGFGFGIGSSIAHSIFSPKEQVKVIHQNSNDNKEYCSGVFESYKKCITEGACSEDLVNHLKESYDKCKSE